MAFRTWAQTLGTAAGAAFLAAAGQFGVGTGLGLLRWDGDFASRAAWHSQLAWLAFLTALATVAGAAAGRWAPAGFAGTTLTEREPRWARAALCAAAALGAAAVIPVGTRPAHGVHLPEPGPAGTAASTAMLLALVLGVAVGYAALSVPAVGGNVVTYAIWLWLAALASALWTLGRHSDVGTAPGPVEHAAGRLGLLPPAGTVTSIVLLLTAPAAIGLLAALVSRFGGGGRLAVAYSGAAGPLLVAGAYVIAGPAGQGVAYWCSLAGVAVGVAASAFVALARHTRLATPSYFPSRTPDRPWDADLDAQPDPATDPADDDGRLARALRAPTEDRPITHHRAGESRYDDGSAGYLSGGRSGETSLTGSAAADRAVADLWGANDPDAGSTGSHRHRDSWDRDDPHPVPSPRSSLDAPSPSRPAYDSVEVSRPLGAVLDPPSTAPSAVDAPAPSWSTLDAPPTPRSVLDPPSPPVPAPDTSATRWPTPEPPAAPRPSGPPATSWSSSEPPATSRPSSEPAPTSRSSSEPASTSRSSSEPASTSWSSSEASANSWLSSAGSAGSASYLRAATSPSTPRAFDPPAGDSGGRRASFFESAPAPDVPTAPVSRGRAGSLFDPEPVADEAPAGRHSDAADQPDDEPAALPETAPTSPAPVALTGWSEPEPEPVPAGKPGRRGRRGRATQEAPVARPKDADYDDWLKDLRGKGD
jgi:hypothetical protein